MKTTVDIQDELYRRARERARSEGRTVRSLIEEGLRLRLELGSEVRRGYVLPDESFGDPQAPDPLATMSWEEIRDEIYGGR